MDVMPLEDQSRMIPIRAAKKDLRRLMRSKLSATPAESVAVQSQKIMDALISLPEYRAARRVSVYMSMTSGEVATGSVVHDALQHGKHVYIPYTHRPLTASSDQPSLVMDMVSLHSPEDYAQLQPDIWGIPSPSQESIKARKSCLEQLVRRDLVNGTRDFRLDMIIVPGMAFDAHRRRLGHGKGFYDYFLKRYQDSHQTGPDGAAKMPFLAGLALREQVLPEADQIPTEASDWRLDCLIVGDGRILRAPEESPSS